MEDNKFPREISLCLSGGAAKGAFHLGVIDVLEEFGVSIKAISGTSIGALIGASLASGKSSKEILEILKSKEFRSVFKLRFNKGYIYSIDLANPIIKKLVNASSFEALKIPFELAITDIDNAQAVYVSSGERLHEYILASCAIAPLVGPNEIDGTLYADGGLSDNFPVELLKKYPYKILGVNLYPHISSRPASIFGWIKKVIFVAWQAPSLAKRNKCDYYISSDQLSQINMFSFKDIDKAYKMGKEAMRSKKDIWKIDL